MKRKITMLCALVCLMAGMEAQNVTVTDAIGQMPGAFIQNNLMGGGVYIFNAKFSNSQSAISTANIGTFQANGFAGIQMNNGIIMTTGNISVAPGPNSAGGSSSPIAGYYSDPTMEMVATNTINGCATLDFDFVTLSSNVYFNYSFASEEYPEYVCSNFNDVFAFFLTGPDPVTGEEVTRNIAIIPNTISDTNPNGIAVAINSVNNGTAGSYGGSGSGCYYDYSTYYNDNPSDDNGIQYDGYTMKLTATAQILPCVVYHMHISVCNVGDNSYDSGVFLEGNSFTANTASIGLSRPGSTGVHGMCPAEIPLTLGGTDYDEGLVFFRYGGNAVAGVDYEVTDQNGNPLDSINGLTISNDVTNFVIKGLPGADLSTEKTIEVYLATALCPAFPQLLVYDTMHFTLDAGTGVVVADTTITCTHACFEVGTRLISGSNASYMWQPTTGLDDPYSLTTSAFITESRDYQLIATGGTGCNSDTAEVRVVIQNSDGGTPVGIEEIEGKGYRIYPNPADKVLHIELTGENHLRDADGYIEVTIYNTKGEKVLEKSYDSTTTHGSVGHTGTVDIATEELETGVYILQLITREGSRSEKLIIGR